MKTSESGGIQTFEEDRTLRGLEGNPRKIQGDRFPSFFHADINYSFIVDFLE